MEEILKKYEINLDDDEALGAYSLLSNMYVEYNCIIRKGSDDLGSAIEDTLHRLKDAGASDEEILFATGAFVPEDPDQYDEETNINIDLGYILEGPILTYREIA